MTRRPNNATKGHEWRKLALLSVACGMAYGGLIVGALLLSGGQRALNKLKVWESSDADANHEMVMFSEALAEKATASSVLSDVKSYKQLRAAPRGEHVVYVSTPPRFSADNWVAWIEFRRSGRLFRATFGTVNYTARDTVKPAGIPNDRCYGTPQECSLPFPLSDRQIE